MPLLDGKFFSDWIIQPDSSRIGANRVYRCLIAGRMLTFFVGSAAWEDRLKPLILRRKKWLGIKASVDEMPSLREACLRIGKANAIRSLGSA